MNYSISSIEKLRNDCIERWEVSDLQSDEVLTFFDVNFTEWMNQFPEDMRSIIELLLENFTYLSQKKVLQFMVESFKKIGICLLTNNVHFITFPKKDGDVYNNSSYDYIYHYKTVNNMQHKKIVSDFASFGEKYPDCFDAILIVDDLCGTGNTFVNFVSENEILKDKKIYYVVTCIMEDAKKKIDTFSEKKNIDIELVYGAIYDRAFNKIQFENNKIARHNFRKMSLQFGIHNKYLFGYKDSEALLAFYNNTPNNTLGLLWYNSKEYFSIFPRDNEERRTRKKMYPLEMKMREKARDKFNYYSKQRIGYL